MDPFVTLGVPFDTDDAEVETRYDALTRRYPPDRDPEVFARVREAYERLRTADLRADAQLSYVDPMGDHAALAAWVARTARRPVPMSELAALVRSGLP